jgi:hypothetical protein
MLKISIDKRQGVGYTRDTEGMHTSPIVWRRLPGDFFHPFPPPDEVAVIYTKKGGESHVR